MNWYIAKVIFQIICGDGNHKPQFDEQLRVVSGENIAEAFQKACSIGKKEEDTFMNNNQKMVQWKFINVPEIYCLSEIVDGAEIYSKVEEADNADLYKVLVNGKAERLKKEVEQPIVPFY